MTPKHNPNHRYRLCKQCGKEWNVSVKSKHGKQYICPRCEYKERKKNNV